MDKVIFLDTTLRDGEQTPSVNFNKHDKLQIALQLEKFGVDQIEAGFPASSVGDFEAVQLLSKEIKDSTIQALARSKISDIDRAYEAIKNANHPQIHVFIATSPIHMEHKLKMTQSEVLASITKHVSYAKSLVSSVEFSAEDATRSEIDFLIKAIQTAIDAGATIINIPDTVGYSNPVEFGQLVRYIIENTKHNGEILFSPHCHNDFGLAVANSLAAIENGARRIEGAINGLGERAGNASIEEIGVALKIRQDYYKVDTNLNLSETMNTSQLVAKLSGIQPQKNKAVVGANAFSHESGIHQDGVLKNPLTYEIITPELVGFHNSLPLGKLSGRHAFTDKLTNLGYVLEAEKIDELFKKFKDLADKKKHITDDDIRALVINDSSFKPIFEVDQLDLNYLPKEDNLNKIEAHIKVLKSGEFFGEYEYIGNGAVESIFGCLDKVFENDTELLYYTFEAVTTGIDSQAEVNVTVQNKNTKNNFTTFGLDYDVLLASAKAYLQAQYFVSIDK